MAKNVDSEAGDNGMGEGAEIVPAAENAEGSQSLADYINSEGNGSDTQAAGTGKKKDSSPGDGQPAGGTDQGDGEEEAGAADSSEKKPMSKEDFDKAARERLGMKGAGPETVDSMRAQLRASSAESKRLVQQREAINEFMKAKGLKIVDGRDGPDIVPLDDYKSPEVDGVARAIASALSKDDTIEAAEDAAKFAEKIAARAVAEATKDRLLPTRREADIRIPEEMKEVYDLQLAAAKGVNGEELCPDYQELRPYVDGIMDSAEVPESFRDFMERSQEAWMFGRRVLYGLVHQRIAPLLAEQRAAEAKLAGKKKDAEEDVSLADEGTQGAVRGKKKSAAQSEADEIISAKPVW